MDIEELARRIKAAPTSDRLAIVHHGDRHEVHLRSESGPVIFGPDTIEAVTAFVRGFTAGVVATTTDRYLSTTF